MITIFYNGRRQNEITLNTLSNFSSGRLSFGRSLENDIVLPFPTVSRKHGEFRLSSGRVKVIDTGSLNKLSADREPATELLLSNGAEIALAPYKKAENAVILQYEAQSDELPPVKRHQTADGGTAAAVKERPPAIHEDEEPPKALKANLLDRAIAGAVDYIVWFVLWLCVLLAILITHLNGGIYLSLLLLMIVGWLYFGLMESSARQATIGKIILGHYVVDQYGGRISFITATVRFFLKLLSTLIVGIGLLPVFGGRTLHDKLSNTKVVKYVA